jgi:hypothetical protein
MMIGQTSQRDCPGTHSVTGEDSIVVVVVKCKKEFWVIVKLTSTFLFRFLMTIGQTSQQDCPGTHSVTGEDSIVVVVVKMQKGILEDC